MLARIHGRWLTCGGFIYQPAGTIGLELAGKKGWFLVEGANGTAVRGTGSAYERTVTIIDTIAMNGPGPYRFQMDLTLKDGRFDTYFVESFRGPTKLVLNEGTSGNVAEYTRAGASGTGSYDAGDGFDDAGFEDAGSSFDAALNFDDAGFEDAGFSFDDAGFDDAGASFGDASTSSCSLAGTWDVTSNVPFGTLSSFQFESNGTFVGGPRFAALPAAEAFSGSWAIEADGEASFWNTAGMLCNAGPTNMSATYGANCATVTLQVVTDACTGAREQLDDTTVLARR